MSGKEEITLSLELYNYLLNNLLEKLQKVAESNDNRVHVLSDSFNKRDNSGKFRDGLINFSDQIYLNSDNLVEKLNELQVKSEGNLKPFIQVFNRSLINFLESISAFLEEGGDLTAKRTSLNVCFKILLESRIAFLNKCIVE